MRTVEWVKSFCANGNTVEIEFSCLYKDKVRVTEAVVNPRQFANSFARLVANLRTVDLNEAMKKVSNEIEEYLKTMASDDAEFAAVISDASL